MFYINSVFSSSCINWSRNRQFTAPEKMPETIREGSNERGGFIWCMPLHYSSLPLRRRLIRMMLTLQKYGEASDIIKYAGINVFTPETDYAQSVIDTAMLRGELHCRPSTAMTRAFLAQVEELRSIVANVQHDKALLRREVRRRTTYFLRRYAADAGA